MKIETIEIFDPKDNINTYKLDINSAYYYPIVNGKIEYHNEMITAFHGIRWIYYNDEKELKSVEIFENNVRIYGCPTLDFEKMLLVFNGDSKILPKPSNMGLFDIEGNLIKKIEIPQLISGLTYTKNNPPYFAKVKVSHQKKILVQINFGNTSYERRFYDSNTDTFGDLFDSSEEGHYVR